MPVQSAGDHQVEHDPEIAFEADGDALAHAAEFTDHAAVGVCERRLGGAKKKRCGDSNPIERLREDAGFECGKVGGYVGEFGHAYKIAGGTRGFATTLFTKGQSRRRGQAGVPVLLGCSSLNDLAESDAAMLCRYNGALEFVEE